MTPLITTDALTKDFTLRGGVLRAPQVLRAVDRVTLTIDAGESLVLVGESGSGKTTLGRMLVGLTEPTSGSYRFDGRDLARLAPAARRETRAQAQMVFQDASAAFNPRRTIAASLEVPLRYNRRLSDAEAHREAAHLLDRVGLSPAVYLNRYPHELSGGQRQRVGLARALASKPRFIVADEPVSALDVSVRAQALRLMRELQREDGLALLFITHDLGVARVMADRVMVMYLGALVEEGPVTDVLTRPAHPYTRSLLAATPVPAPTRPPPRQRLVGDIPSPLDVPRGCRFHTRCPFAHEQLTEAERSLCHNEAPPVVTFPSGQGAACHYAARVRTAN